jgi:hypothetical protein
VGASRRGRQSSTGEGVAARHRERSRLDGEVSHAPQPGTRRTGP